MNRKNISLRLLQLYCLLAATIAVVGGGTYLLAGIDGVARVVGTEYAELVPLLEHASTNIDSEIRVTFSSAYRALGWYWLTMGVMLLWIIPKVHLRTDWFRFIHIGFMAAGVATVVGLATHGTNIHTRYDALIPEFGVPAAAILWQWFVARGARDPSR